MKMNIRPLAKITTASLLLGGALCWSAMAGDATQLWDMNCAGCHGKDGKGNTMMGHMLHIKDLTDAKVQAALTDEQATKDIKEGIKEDGRTKMKAFGDKLTDDQIKDLVAHVRSFKSAK
jgi:mono/diheme cytochrome c family protein